jgi:hypothetical protein
MAELRLKIPEELKEEIEKSEIDLSFLVKRLVKQLEEEREMIDWSVKLQRASRYGRFDELKKKGLI